MSVSADRIAGVFETQPLPRFRAVLALVFAAAGLLSLGGALSYVAGSPDVHGPSAPQYWATFFAFYTAAFGGAALVGAFPRLSRAAIKGGWLLLTALLWAGALHIRFSASSSPADAAEWCAVTRPYLIALVPLVAGLCWRSKSLDDTEPSS